MTSAGPPGVMELMMVPRSERPEFSPPTTWKPGEEKPAQTRCQHTNTEMHYLFILICARDNEHDGLYLEKNAYVDAHPVRISHPSSGLQW